MSGPPDRQITSTVVTDVGGTKRDIVAAARALPTTTTFVGGHPLGGGERGGFGFARPDLFAGRPWIFTPDGRRLGGGRRAALSIRDRPWARSRRCWTPTSTIALMAFVSHLPQLAASALMDTVGSAAQGEGLRMAGRGLVDTTRLASSPADVWRDICLTNADAIGDALDCFIAPAHAAARRSAARRRRRGDLRRGREMARGVDEGRNRTRR